MTYECESCGDEAPGVEEYCHHCGQVFCKDCLQDEWCIHCRDEHWSSLPEEVKRQSIKINS